MNLKDPTNVSNVNVWGIGEHLYLPRPAEEVKHGTGGKVPKPPPQQPPPCLGRRA
jgi:hypothetical protein